MSLRENEDLARHIFADEDLAGRHGEVSVRCPYPDHPDKHPSASVNIGKGVFRCHACDRGGTILQLARELGHAPAPTHRARKRTPADFRDILEGPFNVPASELQRLGFERRAAELVGLRQGMRGELIWPVYNAAKKLVAVKLRAPGDSVKSRSIGPTSKALLGGERVAKALGKPVLVTAGEKDMTVAVGLLLGSWDGVVAATATGETSWPPAYSEHLAERDVVLLYDDDAPGRDGAKRAAAKLSQFARSVRIATLSPFLEYPNDKDIADLAQRLGSDAARNALLTAIQDASPPPAFDQRAPILQVHEGRYHEPIGSNGETRPISSFTLKLKEIVHQEETGDVFRVELATLGKTHSLDLLPEAFESARTFRRAINRIAGAWWTGGTSSLATLKEQLAREANGQRRRGVSQLGRHGDVFVFRSDLVVCAHGPDPAPPVVFAPTAASGTVARRVVARWGKDRAARDMLEQVLPRLFRLQARETIGPIIGFLHAGFFRPWLLVRAALVTSRCSAFPVSRVAARLRFFDSWRPSRGSSPWSSTAKAPRSA